VHLAGGGRRLGQGLLKHQVIQGLQGPAGHEQQVMTCIRGGTEQLDRVMGMSQAKTSKGDHIRGWIML
jgi:hypothetical protein